MVELLPKETSTFKRVPLKVAALSAWTIWMVTSVVVDAARESVTVLLWALPGIAILVAWTLGALIPFGDLQRFVAPGLFFAWLGSTWSVTSLYRLGRSPSSDVGSHVLTLGGGAVLLVGGVYFLGFVWKWRGLFVLTPELVGEARKIPSSVGGYYRDVSVTLDDGSQIPVAGVFRDRYVRYGPFLRTYSSTLRGRRIMAVAPKSSGVTLEGKGEERNA